MGIKIEDAVEQIGTLVQRLVTEALRMADTPLARRVRDKVPGGHTLFALLERMRLPTAEPPHVWTPEPSPQYAEPPVRVAPKPAVPRPPVVQPPPAPAPEPPPVVVTPEPVIAAVAATPQAQVPELPSASAPTPPIPTGSRIRMLAGTYAGWTGLAQWSPAKNAYNTRLTGPDGQKARTTLSPSALGRVWEVELLGPAAMEVAAVAATATALVEASPLVEAPEAPAADAPTEPAPAAETPAARQPPSGVLPKGTPVRMLGGVYMGLSGVIASVQSRGGPDSIVYVLSLTTPDGRDVRTTVKHASIGRMWVRAD